MLVNIQDESGNFIGQGVDILPHDDGKESEDVHTGVDSSNEFRSNPSTSSQNYSRVDVLRGGGSGLNDNEYIGANSNDSNSSEYVHAGTPPRTGRNGHTADADAGKGDRGGNDGGNTGIMGSFTGIFSPSTPTAQRPKS